MRSLSRVAGLALTLAAAAFPQDADWTTFSGNTLGHRFSTLKQIDKSNAARLKPLWVYQIDKTDKFEASPIVRDGIMYISEPPSDVTALETRSGKVLWKYRRVLPDTLPVCCGKVNRGVAIDGQKVYLGTLDAHLLALDASTGHIIWDVTVAPYQKGYSSTVAPVVVKDMVIIGSAGGGSGWSRRGPARPRSLPCAASRSRTTARGSSAPN
jgi:alcohol dehydrogenase (cytochrome c)